MLELYKFYCEKSNRREDARRYRVLKAVYFKERSIQDVTDAEKIDERTYYRDYRPVSGVIRGAETAAEGAVEGTAQAVESIIP